MPINPSIPLSVANIPPVQIPMRESRMQSLAAIAPGINAMRQLQVSQAEQQEKMQQRQALEAMRKQNLDPVGIGKWLMTNGRTSQEIQLGFNIYKTATEDESFRQAFSGQPTGMPAGGAAMSAQGGAAAIAAPVAQTARPAMAQPAMGQPAAQPAVETVGGKTREEYSLLLTHPNKEVRAAAKAALDQFPKPDREFAPTEIERLQSALAQLPAGHPNRTALEARVRMLTTRPEGTKVEVQVPVYNPATGQVEFASRERIAQGGLQPPSAKPELPGLGEQQAATATRRLLQRAQEIASIVSQNPSAEAPGVVETSVENLPFISRATNLVRSADRQVVASAQADVLDALLYLATGAAYNKEQLEQQKLAYIPSFSDSSSTRALKRQRLVEMIGNAKVRAGRAWTPELDAALQKLVESPAMQGGPTKEATAGQRPAVPVSSPRTPAAASAQGNRREIAPGVFVTERP